MSDQIAKEARAVAVATEYSIRIVIEGVLAVSAQPSSHQPEQAKEEDSVGTPLTGSPFRREGGHAASLVKRWPADSGMASASVAARRKQNEAEA